MIYLTFNHKFIKLLYFTYMTFSKLFYIIMNEYI